MNKKTQMWLGVAALGVVGYWLWQKSQKPKSFMNLASTPPYYPISGGQIVFTRSTAQGGSLVFPQGSQFFQQNGFWYGCIPNGGDCLRLTGPLGATQAQVDGTSY